MELCTVSPIKSLRGNNNLLVHSLSILRGPLGGVSTSKKSLETSLSTSKNSAEDVRSTASSSFIDRRDSRTCSLSTQQIPMQTSRPLFEFLRTQKLITRSFDDGGWRDKATWDDEQEVHCSYESPSSIDRSHWKTPSAFDPQLVLQTERTDDSSEPTALPGDFPETPSRDDTVRNFYCEGKRAVCLTPRQSPCLRDVRRYSRSNDSCGKDQSPAKTSVNTNESTERHMDTKGVKNDRLLFKYRPREVNNEDQSIEFQSDKSREAQSQTLLVHETEFKQLTLSADSTCAATTRTSTANDLHEASSLSNTKDSEPDKFSIVKRKTNISLDDQPTIAQLWAQASQNNRSFRRYGRILNKTQHEQSGPDYEALFRLNDARSDKTKSMDTAEIVRHFFGFIDCGMMPKHSAQGFREQRLRLLALAKMQFDHSNDRHVSILQEIYRLYTGSRSDNVETMGEHWKELGFRGMDPALELRSGGVLTLLFLLYFHKKDPLTAIAILEESKRYGGVYPFASICVAVTTWALKMIKTHKFSTIVKDMDINNKEWMENKEERLFLAAKKLFTGLMYKFHWKVTRRQGGNIDLLKVCEQVQREMKKDVEIILRIADLPEILELGEHFFRRLTRFQQIKQSIKLTFTCFQSKDLDSNEENS